MGARTQILNYVDNAHTTNFVARHRLYDFFVTALSVSVDNHVKIGLCIVVGVRTSYQAMKTHQNIPAGCCKRQVQIGAVDITKFSSAGTDNRCRCTNRYT